METTNTERRYYPGAHFLLAQNRVGLLRLAFEMTRVAGAQPAPHRPRLFLETALLAYPREVRVACREFEEVLLSGLRRVVEKRGLPQREQDEELEAFVADLTALGRTAARLKLDSEPETLPDSSRRLGGRILELLRELGAAAALGAVTP